MYTNNDQFSSSVGCLLGFTLPKVEEGVEPRHKKGGKKKTHSLELALRLPRHGGAPGEQAGQDV